MHSASPLPIGRLPPVTTASQVLCVSPPPPIPRATPPTPAVPCDGWRRERAGDGAGTREKEREKKSGNPESPQRDGRQSLSFLLLDSTPATLPGNLFGYCAWESQCTSFPTFSLPSSDGEKAAWPGSAGGGELARKTYRLLRPPLHGRRSNSGAKLPEPPGAGLCSPSPGAPFCFVAGTARCGRSGGRGSALQRVEPEAPEDWSAVERRRASQPLKGRAELLQGAEFLGGGGGIQSDTVSTAQLFK